MFCTTGIISVLENNYWIADIISVLVRELLYCGDNFCTGKIIIVRRESVLYWNENYCTVVIISVLER